jgi:DNA-binding transcriptional ArsR family regulator
MSRLLPFQSDTEVPDDRAPRVVDLDGEDAEKVFGALSSETARAIFQSLHDDPMTASDIADAVDSSIQNVRYHLENLEDAGLVAVVDTWYSSRGNEMKVYAPKDGPLIVSSDESRASRLRTALSRLVGGVGVLAAASVLLQYGSRELFTTLGGTPAGTEGGTAGGSGDGAAPAPDGDEPLATESTNATTTAEEADVSIQDATTTAAEGTSTEAMTETQAMTTEAEATIEAEATTEAEATEAAQEGTSVDYAAQATETARETATSAASDGGGLLDLAMEPGVMFFLGGVVVLLALLAYQYRSTPY